MLKSKLAESHLEVAIIKSELASVRADYESKKEEMMSDSSALAESTRQAQNLERQLQLLLCVLLCKFCPFFRKIDSLLGLSPYKGIKKRAHKS